MVDATHAGDVGELVGAVAVVSMDVRCGGRDQGESGEVGK
jgi:hypothetical protein